MNNYSCNRAHIILGSVIAPQLNELAIVSLIATGFDQQIASFAKKDIQEAPQKNAPEVVYHKKEEVALSQQHKDILQRVEQKQQEESK